MTDRAPSLQFHRKTGPFDAVAIGASAGAVEALSAILPALPSDYPLPVFVVVHLPPDKKSVIGEVFRGKCAMRVRETEDKDTIVGGIIYFAPPDYHLQIEGRHRVSLSSDEPVFFSRPSIDVLFETAADVYGERMIGVILSGANSDGACGLKAISDAGGVALVQRPELAYAAEMPRAALATCPTAQAMTLQEIAAYLQEVVESK